MKSVKMLWTQCDELNRPFFLTDGDWCAFYEQYYQGDYSCSSGNSLISNFKKNISCRNTSQWKYKEAAVDEYAKLLAKTQFRGGDVLVPAPTSKTRSSALFDNRLDWVAKVAKSINSNMVFASILEAVQDQDAVHYTETATRNPEVLIKNMRLVAPLPNDVVRVYIFDDVLTTGGHFVAAKRLINTEYPSVEVRGLFLALRIFSPPP